jgi:chromate reductase
MVLASIADMLPDGTMFATIDVGSMPHYNEDFEKAQIPEGVVYGREIVAASDAVVIVSPEFNHGIPGVLKNTLDWLSRPAFESCILGKPVFFATVSPGALGGVRAQYQLRETLASMQCTLFPLPEIAITAIGGKVAKGRLVEPVTLKFVQTVLDRFLAATKF